MFLEQLWPHLPTPLVYALVLTETFIVSNYSTNYVAVSLAFITVLTASFVMGSVTLSRPFHFERIAVIVTLAFVNAVFLAQHLPDVYNFLHLHTEESMLAARIIYGIVWLLLVIISIVAYFRNSGKPVSRAWPVLAIVTLIAIFIPLEPDAFVMNQPAWLWILRVLSALIVFHLVTLGDTAVVVEGLYYQRVSDSTHTQRHKSSTSDGNSTVTLREPTSDDAEIPLARTLIWLPITLWVMFVPKAFVFLVVFIILLMAQSVYDRFQRATKAHRYFIQTQSIFAKTSRVVGIDRILDAIYDIENQVIGVARDQARTLADETTMLATERKQLPQRRFVPDSDSNDQTLVDIIDDPEYRSQQSLTATRRNKDKKKSDSIKRW